MKKVIFLGALALCSSMAMAADATKKPVSKWTCEDFLALDESFQPKAIYFAEGFNKKDKPVDAVMDTAGIEKIVPLVIQECQQAPKATFWSKIKSSWAKIKASM